MSSTFFPWADAHSSRAKKVAAMVSSALLRPLKRVRRRSSFGLVIAIEAAVVAVRNNARRLEYGYHRFVQEGRQRFRLRARRCPLAR